jgi:hypothetical protein
MTELKKGFVGPKLEDMQSPAHAPNPPGPIGIHRCKPGNAGLSPASRKKGGVTNDAAFTPNNSPNHLAKLWPYQDAIILL